MAQKERNEITDHLEDLSNCLVHNRLLLKLFVNRVYYHIAKIGNKAEATCRFLHFLGVF